jgi:hypothetical protein
LTLDPPNMQEALQILATRLDPGLIARDPEATREIIDSCARLPLALAVAAASAAANPRRPLRELAAALQPQLKRLDTLASDNVSIDIRAVFSCSYQQLSTPARKLFRLLGLHPGPDISIPVAASLAAAPPGSAQLWITELVAANLLVERVPGRYVLHDLLRVYAAELLNSVEPRPKRLLAIHRLMDHYLFSAQEVRKLLHPRRRKLNLGCQQPGVSPERFADRGQASAWLTAECPAVLSVLKYATELEAQSESDPRIQTYMRKVARALAQILQLAGLSGWQCCRPHQPTRSSQKSHQKSEFMTNPSPTSWHLGVFDE